MTERFDQDLAQIIGDLRVRNYSPDEIRGLVGNIPQQVIVEGSAQHLAGMRPEDRARYLRTVIGREGDANFHQAMRTNDLAGNHREFTATPRTPATQRFSPGRGRHR